MVCNLSRFTFHFSPFAIADSRFTIGVCRFTYTYLVMWVLNYTQRGGIVPGLLTEMQPGDQNPMACCFIISEKVNTLFKTKIY